MKKFLVLLAIFCVLGSAVAVSAADVYDDQGVYSDDGMYDDDYVDDYGGWAGSNYQDDGGWAGSQYNESAEELTGRPIIDPDYAHMEPGANSTGNATGEPVANETANVTVSAATHTMPATGNPILALLAVCAVLGGAAVLKRK